VRFGRRSATSHEQGDETPDEAVDPGQGPFDESEVDTEDRECVDLGGLLVTPGGPMELRLSVDEESGNVLAAVLVDQDSALELRAFSASRGPGSWDELRPQIVEETQRMGGQVQEVEGTFGHELLCHVPVQTPEGEQGVQASRVIGIEGPRWLLRATLMGQAALEDRVGEVWETSIRNTVVRRGREAMPPMTALPLHLPPEARRVE
jgi:hypothetical protein